MAAMQSKPQASKRLAKLNDQESWLNRRQAWFKLLSAQEKFFLGLIIGVSTISLVMIAYAVFRPSKSMYIEPVDNQEVDQSAVDAALDQLNKDSSTIPSGAFHPEKGDYFKTSDTDSEDQEAANQ